MINNTFDSNHAYYAGGALYGVGIDFLNESQYKNTYINNSAVYYGDDFCSNGVRLLMKVYGNLSSEVKYLNDSSLSNDNLIYDSEVNITNKFQLEMVPAFNQKTILILTLVDFYGNPVLTGFYGNSPFLNISSGSSAELKNTFFDGGSILINTTVFGKPGTSFDMVIGIGLHMKFYQKYYYKNPRPNEQILMNLPFNQEENGHYAFYIPSKLINCPNGYEYVEKAEAGCYFGSSGNNIKVISLSFALLWLLISLVFIS